ncbi:hypothetical protein [Aurantibacillus circumpalustris]|uniref:hypothetical protein n=1 Tax=Aurantibacillus circumpalustris TaxID=3036359 RepID=UPI00295AE409|nr:hypothetical protein [Aurantibacillus circumpalustris]
MLREVAKNQVLELKAMLDQLHESDYAKPMIVFNNGTVGKHVRHILEFYDCLFVENENNTICYDDRKRNLLLEENLRFASEFIIEVFDKIERVDVNKRILLKVVYNATETIVESSLFREITYNIEHTVHHLAIMRIAFTTELNYVKLNSSFGYSHSTLQYLKSQKTIS